MRIFISHASADHALAEQLVDVLRESGLAVWSPYDSVLPGDNMARAIGEALEECDVMVVLFTRAANESPNVRNEVQFALTRGNYRGRVLPVLVDFVTFEAGAGVPWILLRLNPVYLNGSPLDFSGVVDRVRSIAEAAANASA